jgi:membrane protein implicated in regulation of membrane protease activity
VLLLGGILLAVFIIPWPWGIAAVIGGGALDVLETLVLLRWSRRRRSVSGAEALVGQTAVVARDNHVRVAGELWAARADGSLREGDVVRVESVDGLTLRVTLLNRAPR